MVDYHVHPDFSHDASGSVEEFCERAVAIGLTELCFTSHYEPDPKRKDVEYVRVGGRSMPVASDWAKYYFAAIEQARRKFPNLVVLAGVEVGYEPGLEGMIHDFLSKHPFDFVLGAVHCLDSVCLTAHEELDRFKATFAEVHHQDTKTQGCGQPEAGVNRQERQERHVTDSEFHHQDTKAPRVGHSEDGVNQPESQAAGTPKPGGEEVAERYLLHLRAAAGSTLFDCLAHLDIYRKYIEPLFDGKFGKTIEAGLPGVLQFIARSGTGIEVNTSAFRRGNPEPYPTSSILHLASDIGVRVFTVGSDAHKPEDLGTGLDRAEAIFRDLGVTPARFRQRKQV